jgi:hypothetical protein
LALTGWGALTIDRFDDPRVGTVTLVHAAFYALAAWIVVTRPPEARGRALAVILMIGFAMRLLLLPGQPISNDVYRYVWDGRVQAAGINPYLYVPADGALANLRDEWIFPNINRADYAPTIYPPMAQIVFFLVTRVSETVTFMKVAMVGFEAIAVWAILKLLIARGQPATNVLLYVWHPLPLWEFARSGHVDAVAIACVMLGFLAAERRRPVWAGVALAAGTLVKYTPAVAGPGLYRRWDWRLPAAFVGTAAILYLPYLGASAKVVGFLPRYLAEERFDDGQGFWLWRALDAALHLPAVAVVVYLAAAAATMIALALYVVLRERKPGADLLGAMVLITTFLFLLTPHYVWYFAWLVPFLCFYPSAAVIYLTCAINWLYLGQASTWLADGLIIYGGFVAVLVAEGLVRRQFRKEAQRGDAVTA